MGKRIISLFFLALVLLTTGLSVWGPEAFSRWKDRSLLGRIHRQEVELSGEGYRYEMSASEKLYVLSQALGSRNFPESGQYGAWNGGAQYQESGGNYALIINHRGLEETAEDAASGEEVCETCNEGLRVLKSAGLLPESVAEVDPGLYDAVLYSAIDVREPRNYVPVWKLSLADDIRGIRKENRPMDLYLDADDGKIYEFYVRTQWEWEDIDPDTIVQNWCSYLGLPEPFRLEDDNPLSESTPFFKKYIIPGEGEEQTVVTVGFYEGIREFFIKISR
jgi:hypothetical protein